MKLSTKNLLYVLAAILALGAGYWFFFRGAPPEAPISADKTESGVATFLAHLGELGPIHFDTSIFSDPRFTALTDIGTPIFHEPTGRHDFFAPIGSP